MITTNQVLKHFGSVAAAAEFFDVHPSAVYQWVYKKQFPARRAYELMVRLPEHFARGSKR
jgi:DUF971 family protein